MRISCINLGLNNYKLNKINKSDKQNNSNPILGSMPLAKVPLAQLQSMSNISFGANKSINQKSFETYNYIFTNMNMDILIMSDPKKLQMFTGLLSNAKTLDKYSLGEFKNIADSLGTSAAMPIEHALINQLSANPSDISKYDAPRLDLLNKIFGDKTPDVFNQILQIRSNGYTLLADMVRNKDGKFNLPVAQKCVEILGDKAPDVFYASLMEQDKNGNLVLSNRGGNQVFDFVQAFGDNSDEFIKKIRANDRVVKEIAENLPDISSLDNAQMQAVKKIFGDKASDIYSQILSKRTNGYTLLADMVRNKDGKFNLHAAKKCVEILGDKAPDVFYASLMQQNKNGNLVLSNRGGNQVFDFVKAFGDNSDEFIKKIRANDKIIKGFINNPPDISSLDNAQMQAVKKNFGDKASDIYSQILLKRTNGFTLLADMVRDKNRNFNLPVAKKYVEILGDKAPDVFYASLMEQDKNGNLVLSNRQGNRVLDFAQAFGDKSGEFIKKAGGVNILVAKYMKMASDTKDKFGNNFYSKITPNQILDIGSSLGEEGSYILFNKVLFDKSSGFYTKKVTDEKTQKTETKKIECPIVCPIFNLNTDCIKFLSKVLGKFSPVLFTKALLFKDEDGQNLLFKKDIDYLNTLAKALGDKAAGAFASALLMTDKNGKNVLFTADNEKIRAIAKILGKMAPETFAKAVLVQDKKQKNVFHTATPGKVMLLNEIMGDLAKETIAKAILVPDEKGKLPIDSLSINKLDAISMILGAKASEMELRTLFAQAPEYRDLTKYVAGDYIRQGAKQMGDIAPKMYAQLLITQDSNKKNILHIAMNDTINALSEVTKDEAKDSFAQALQMKDIYGNTPLFYTTSDQLDLYRKILADKASEIIDSSPEV